MLGASTRPLWLRQLLQSTTIPALTLTEPWGTAMALGAKHFETRSWQRSYRGLLAIHTAKGFPEWAEELCDEEPFQQILQGGGYVRSEQNQHNRWCLPLGQVIAIGMLEEVERITETYPAVSDQERALGNYAPGRYVWRFSGIYRLRMPVATRGSLGLWSWDPPDSFWQEIQAACKQEETK